MAKQTKKRKALNATLTGVRGTVKFLQPYFYQGGKWHKLKTVKRKINKCGCSDLSNGTEYCNNRKQHDYDFIVKGK